MGETPSDRGAMRSVDVRVTIVPGGRIKEDPATWEAAEGQIGCGYGLGWGDEQTIRGAAPDSSPGALGPKSRDPSTISKHSAYL